MCADMLLISFVLWYSVVEGNYFLGVACKGLKHNVKHNDMHVKHNDNNE